METKTQSKQWHVVSIKEALQQLNTSEKAGLNQGQLQELERAWGKNKLPEEKKAGPLEIFLRQFRSPLVYILLIAAGLTLWLQEFVDMTVILIVVAVNAAIGFFQEYRASKIFEKLQQIVKVKTLVIRGGEKHQIDAEELVPGDIVILKGGSKVPADVRLLSVEGLEINEALLTGESVPVTKSLDRVDESAVLGDRKNMGFMGTVIEQGEAHGLVVATGARTEIGKISVLTQSATQDETPLQIRVGRLGKLLTNVVVIISAVIFGVGVMSGHSLNEMITTSVAVAVAAIPEGLPAAISVILAVSSQKILKRKGLVRRLVAAETLGSTSVICTDKTGTLTYGEMRAEKFITTDKPAFLETLALANEAEIEIKQGEAHVVGEATDKAKMEAFLSAGGSHDQLTAQKPRVALLPFDPERKYIASFHKASNYESKRITNTASTPPPSSPSPFAKASEDRSPGEGELGFTEVHITGAPEKLIGLSKLSVQKQALLRSQYEEFAKSGYRVIAGARKRLSSNYESKRITNTASTPPPSSPSPFAKASEDRSPGEEDISELEFLGLVAIRDPIRPDVKQTIRITREAGVRVLMITGDHLFTARAIGHELGFSNHENAVISGSDLDQMSDQELRKKMPQIEIIARATPAHKMRVIDTWQELGAVVAMTGDGVNDAPALKSADIGVAVGSGTDVTKEASDLVLLNDSFSTITAAVRQGRIGFANIKKVSILLLTNSFSEIMLILSALLFALPFPITAVQILWVNLVEDSLPVLALAFEPGEKGVMKLPPLKKSERIVDSEARALIFLIGLITNVVLIGAYLYLLNADIWSLNKIRTFIFASIGTDTLLYIFAFKSLKTPLWKINMLNNKYLLGASLIGFATLFAAVYIPILNKFLETVPLDLPALAVVLVFGFAKLALVEVVKWRYRVHST